MDSTTDPSRGTGPTDYRVLIDGTRPAFLTKQQLVRVFGSPKVVQRLLYASRRLNGRQWLTFRRMRRHVLVTVESVESAVARMRDEQPPLLPSEAKRRCPQRPEAEEPQASRMGTCRQRQASRL